MARVEVQTRQPPPLTIALALAGVLLLVLVGVVAAALLVGELGGATGDVGDVPPWMSVWLVVLGAFLALILGWSIWALSGWLGMWVMSRR